MHLVKKNHISGSALVMVMVVISASLLMLGAALSWMSNNKTLTHRYNQYTRSTAAAEAATEKVIVAINNDYKLLGQTYVLNNLDKYRQMVPSRAENIAWRDYRFTDAQGSSGRTQIEYIKATNLTT